MIELLQLAAQSEVEIPLGDAVRIIRSVSLVLAFAALVFSGLMTAFGNLSYVKYGLIGAVIMGAAWALASAFFEAGAAGSDIEFPEF